MSERLNRARVDSAFTLMISAARRAGALPPYTPDAGTYALSYGSEHDGVSFQILTVDADGARRVDSLGFPFLGFTLRSAYDAMTACTAAYDMVTVTRRDAATAAGAPATARIARRAFVHGDHSDELSRDNCAACALERSPGQSILSCANCNCPSLEIKDAEAPGHAGWLRLYVEAGRPMPREAFSAELARAAAENVRYFDAVMRAVTEYGVKFTD